MMEQKITLKCHDQQCNNQMYELSKENIILKDATHLWYQTQVCKIMFWIYFLKIGSLKEPVIIHNDKYIFKMPF